ncbi:MULTISPECIES: aldo/keto reductase [unclassified Halomonas]|uniref:aldo/keto reductase n=1 Tax=unclassified Halomonas TaxID=2609666 RepID=UPI0007D97AD4|nr:MULTISPECIES: aldo/keto reductase [unclassified Halomonas]MBT2788448.1 aldo/keto reductase [Halomonas sp. ISL-106]MBT2798039.1 aldo/keto reductase [Halomonas sp. ISL-104]OAL60606.1 aldo/keto reductase [Halomonas sp. ALS9]
MPAATFDVPFVLGMMRLHEASDMHDPKQLADWIEARLEQGLNWFDHADIYGGNQGETLFGAALKTRPALARRVHIVTKASIANDNPAPGSSKVKHYNASPAYLSSAIDASLGRLNVERLDHFLIHRPDLLMNADATGRALDDAIEAGKIGAAGISNHLPSQWRRLQGAMHHRLSANQIELSIAHTAPLFDGSFDDLCADGHAPMAWSPLASGQLMQGAVSDCLDKWATKLECAPSALALAWLRSLSNSPVPVIGSVKPERISDMLNGPATLPREAWYELLEAARGHCVA